MPDINKVIRGLERCQKGTCPSIFSNEYADCEYTMGLYCRKDKLINDALELLKEYKRKMGTAILLLNNIDDNTADGDGNDALSEEMV